MNLQKRVKRHVWSQEHRFLVTLPPSFAPLCRAEMEAAGFAEIRSAPEGFYFSGKIEEAYRAQLILRTASRLWLCLPDFKAGAQEELFRKSTRIAWELYLNPSIPLILSARVRRSRIEHEGESATTVLKALRHHFVETGLSAPREAAATADADGVYQRLHLAAENDRVELRIDMSGEHLHKRGYRQQTVEAPLRETLAAAVVQWGLEEWRRAHAGAGWPVRIHDPFCGSGTIPIETALLAAAVAPGSRRDFLSSRQPHFRTAAFSYLRRSLAEAVREPSSRISGSDILPAAVEAARQNAAAGGATVEFETADAFSPATDEKLGPDTLLITNPPYGERLEGSTELYPKLVKQLQETGSSGVILVPSALEERLELPPGHPRMSLDNGGIKVVAVYYQR